MRFLLMICIAAIFAIGVIMIFSTTSAEMLEMDPEKSGQQAVIKQFFYAMGGVALACVAYNVGYRRFLSWSPYLLAFFSFLLLLVLIPGVGRVVNGSRRWLSVGGLSFQPSEFVKYIVPAFFIHRFMLLDKFPWTFKQFLSLIAIPTIPVVLILVEPNNGTAAVVSVTIAVLCFLTRIPLKFWALPLFILGIVGGAFASQLPYVTGRINSYLHPELDLKGKGHQPYQAKIAVGSGGLFGRGPGNSLQKLSYLPEAQNDYIGAIFAEEFGFVGIITLISLYAGIACVGSSIGMRAINQEGLYLSGAVTFLICFQAFLNLGVVSGLLPSTGLNLPFLSQGGSSLMANLMGIGLLLSISKKGEEFAACQER